MAARTPLSVSHPQLSAQLGDVALAETLSAGSVRKVTWRCSVRHPEYTWEASVSSRAGGNGCPACSNRAVFAGWNDLATTHPQLAGELVRPGEAREVIAGSDRRLEWVCRKVHPEYRWFATVRKRAHRGRGCHVCAGKSVLVGWNDLATTHPELVASLVDPSVAKLISFGTSTRPWWKCAAGHPTFRWQAMPTKRATAAHACPVCAGKRVLVGWNDLATTHPVLAASLVDPSLAERVSAGSDARALWLCGGEHGPFTWEATVGSRASQGVGCPACAGQVVVAGWNDLGTTHPGLSRQLVDPDIALRVSAGSGTNAIWSCGAGHPLHQWSATVASRALNGNGCGLCSNRLVTIGHNDLASTNPQLAARLVDPAQAQLVTSGSDRELQWFCDDGHPRFEWPATVASRTRHPIGCPRCYRGGFDQSRYGYLYLLARSSGGEDQRQYGITGNLDARMQTHARSGWVLVDHRRFDDGRDALAAETGIKRAMRSSGTYGTVPADGTYKNAEAWFTGDLPSPVNTISDLLAWAVVGATGGARPYRGARTDNCAA
jgi:Zn ribbon nucleic-acid-binding protein